MSKEICGLVRDEADRVEFIDASQNTTEVDHDKDEFGRRQIGLVALKSRKHCEGESPSRQIEQKTEGKLTKIGGKFALFHIHHVSDRGPDSHSHHHHREDVD